MTSISFVTKQIVRDQQARTGGTKAQAREIVARAMSVPPGTLENLERGRLKSIDRIAGAIHEYLQKVAARQVAELEKQLAIVRAVARDNPDACRNLPSFAGRVRDHVAAAEAAVAAARAVIADEIDIGGRSR